MPSRPDHECAMPRFGFSWTLRRNADIYRALSDPARALALCLTGTFAVRAPGPGRSMLTNVACGLSLLRVRSLRCCHRRQRFRAVPGGRRPRVISGSALRANHQPAPAGSFDHFDLVPPGHRGV